MLSSEWTPDHMMEVEKKWAHLVLPENGEIDHTRAAQLMVQYEAQAQDWAQEYANSQLWEETVEWQMKGKYNLAFLKSMATSDRKKEAEARSDVSVRAAEVRLIEARAATLLAKMRHEASIRGHHMCKALLRIEQDNKWI